MSKISPMYSSLVNGLREVRNAVKQEEKESKRIIKQSQIRVAKDRIESTISMSKNAKIKLLKTSLLGTWQGKSIIEESDDKSKLEKVIEKAKAYSKCFLNILSIFINKEPKRIDVIPSELEFLLENGSITSEDLKYTDDGMVVCTKSLADILKNMGIDQLGTCKVEDYYDDWYIYTTKNEEGEYIYSLYKMREQEYDEFDNNDPGVTISFSAFDINKLKEVESTDTTALYQEIDKVVVIKGEGYDKTLQEYFSDVASEGPYLIAKEYVKKTAQQSNNNVIVLPNQLKNMLTEIDEIDEVLDSCGMYMDASSYMTLYKEKEDLIRVPNALEAINEQAGYTIYDVEKGIINIQNPNDLSYHEEMAILAAYTADVTYNSFSAEVKFHSDALVDWKSWFSGIPGLNKWYNSAIRADMAIGEEYESGYYDKYYNLESDEVREQAQYHGEQ